LAGTSVRNPLDSAVALESEANFTKSVRAIADSGEVDFSWYIPAAIAARMMNRPCWNPARIIVAGARATRLPMVLVVRGMGVGSVKEIQAMVDYCSAAGLAVFPTVAAAAAAVQKARSYYAGQPAYRR